MAKIERFFITNIAPEVYVKNCNRSELHKVVALANRRLETEGENAHINTFQHDSNLTMAAAEKQ